MKLFHVLGVLAVVAVCALAPAGAQSASAADPNGCTDDRMRPLALGVSGPYFLWLMVNPAQPMVGTAQMTVGVCDAQTRAPVPDVRVQLTPTNPAGVRGAPIMAMVHARPEEYGASDIKIKDAGQWHYTVSVDGPRGPGTLEAEMFVSADRDYDQGSSVVFFLVVGTLAAGSGYVIWRIRQQQAARAGV